MIDKIDTRIALVFTLLIGISFLCGRYISIGNIYVYIGLIIFACIIGAAASVWVEQLNQSRKNYEKGAHFEDYLVGYLTRLGFECTSSIETVASGDLDILAIKNGKYFGIEAKNWSGKIRYRDGIMFHNKYPEPALIPLLKKRCVEVKHDRYGVESSVFIHPVCIFGTNAALLCSPEEVKQQTGVEMLDDESMKQFFKSI